MIHVHFYYEIAPQSQNVELILEGMNHNLTMMSYPKANNKHYYFYDLLLDDSCGYPITINYQYRLQSGSLLDYKTITLKYKSVEDYIILKDICLNSNSESTISPSPIVNNSISAVSSKIEALFFLEIPSPLSANVMSVMISSPFPLMAGQKTSQMIYLKEHNLWVSKISIESDFPMPFMYFYTVKTSTNLIFGENRLRIIEFNQPLNRSNDVSCYDYFYIKSLPGNISFYFQPIQFSAFPNDKNQLFETDFTKFELLYLPEETNKNRIKDVGIVMSYDDVVSANLKKNQKLSCWFGNLQFPNDFPMKTYSLRTSSVQANGMDDVPVTFNSPINLLMPIKNILFDNIQTRIVKSEVNMNKLVIYFQLVSLKTVNSKFNICGTFNTIGEFSNFLAKTDISVIHLHIEKVPGSEIFLDPIHLDFSEPIVINFLTNLIENPNIMNVDANLLSQIELAIHQPEKSILNLNILREIKLLILRYDFKIRKNFNAFESFKTVFDGYFKSQISQSEFEYYVQFVCYTQLFANVQKAHKNGIQIITDFSIIDGIISAIDSLPIVSLYSSGIYMSDISNIENQGFSIAQIKEKFREDSNFVATTFCEKRGTNYVIKSEFKKSKQASINNDNDLISFDDDDSGSDLCSIDKEKLNKALLFIDSSLRQFYFSSLIELNKIEEAKSQSNEKSDQNDIFDRLVHVSNFISASLIVDEKMSVKKDPSNLEQFFILSSFSRKSKSSKANFPRSYILPSGLSHLRTSSFLSNANKEKVANEIRGALKRPCSFAAVYLNDLLFCCDLAQINGHSVITGNDPNRRDVLHITVKDLNDQIETASKKINDFVKSS